jgi:hypothetical protein
VAHVGLERRARPQQRDPFGIVLGDARHALSLRRRRAEPRFQQRRRRGRALDETSDLDVVPALVVAQRRIGDAVKQVRAFDHRPHDRARLLVPHLFALGLAHEQIHAIELLPHLAADLLANVSRVLARGDNRADEHFEKADVDVIA